MMIMIIIIRGRERGLLEGEGLFEGGGLVKDLHYYCKES